MLVVRDIEFTSGSTILWLELTSGSTILWLDTWAVKTGIHIHYLLQYMQPRHYYVITTNIELPYLHPVHNYSQPPSIDFLRKVT